MSNRDDELNTDECDERGERREEDTELPSALVENPRFTLARYHSTSTCSGYGLITSVVDCQLAVGRPG